MKILVNTTHSEVKRISTDSRLAPYLGYLLTPRCFLSYSVLQETTLPIAADNSAFHDFCETRYWKMIDNIHRFNIPIQWLTVPDIVGDMDQTLKRWEHYAHRLNGLPLALVAQDGAENAELPWDEFTCLFIGGTTEWKLSAHAVNLANTAHQLGKQIHLGRVNSEKRLRFALDLKADSVDGSGYSRFSKKYLVPALKFLNLIHQQEDFLNG